MSIFNRIKGLLQSKPEHLSTITKPADEAASMPQTEDTFYSYYLFGRAADKPIWTWGNWKSCLPLLQPIIDLSPDIPSIKTVQSIPVKYGKHDQNTSYNKGELKFGSMKWSEDDNRKWTTKHAGEDGWKFFDTEIAFPSRSACHKSGRSPVLFITIHNENLNDVKDTQIDQSVSIHIRTTLVSPEQLSILEENIYQIGEMLKWNIAGKITRPSAFPSDLGMGYTDTIWDGTRGVIDISSLDFSQNYKRYGIEKIFSS